MAERVLQLLGPSTGGIRQHVGVVTKRLREWGWTVHTAGPAGVLDGIVALDHDVPIPAGFSAGALLASRRRLQALAAEFDIIHAHGLKPGWLAPPNPARLVVTVHNLVLAEAAGVAAPLLRAIEARLPARAAATIAVSEGIVERFGDRPGVSVVRPAGPTPMPHEAAADVRARLGLSGHDQLVVAVARLHPQKDLATLIHATARLSKVHTVVIGEGPLRAELNALASACGVSERVHLVGARANPADELAAADVVAVTSIWESGPLVLSEALALGRPVVTTPVGFAPELVVDGETGRVVPIGDVDALAAAIRALLDDPAEAEAMGRAGKTRRDALLGDERLVRDIEAIYRSVLSS
ncbi:MAG: glycosyltransferase [Acidimicrobiales bacterium]